MAGAGNVFQDLEDAIEKLKKDLESHKAACEKNHSKTQADLSQKANRDELAEVEDRLMSRI